MTDSPCDEPPGIEASLEKCRVGDRIPAGMVFAWWGKRGIQWYQPLQEGDGRNDPFDESAFELPRPVWRFERCPDPGRTVLGRPLPVWRRIS